MSVVIHVKYHIHLCPKYGQHRKHFWLCHRPNCEEGEIYLCGLVQDMIYEQLIALEKGRRQGGLTTTGKIKRSTSGKFLKGT